MEFVHNHKKPRMVVEASFNQQVTKFKHSDHFRSHKITQGGTSNWECIRFLWELQIFIFNLFTCSAGSQVTGALGATPHTVHEYVYSCHNDLLINIPLDDNEDNFAKGNVYYV